MTSQTGATDDAHFGVLRQSYRQIEDVTLRLAAAGYAALAPDLFAVNGQRPAALREERIAETVGFVFGLPPEKRFNVEARQTELDRLPGPERQRISETTAALFPGPGGRDVYLKPLRNAVRYLRGQRPEPRGQKLGCVGICMGGGLATLLACEEPEVSAAVSYYGAAPSEEKIAGLRAPVLAFYGGEDQRINAAIPEFERAMGKAGKSLEYHVYQGAGHSFFNDTLPSYHVAAARDSFARMLTFFSKHLPG